LALGVSYSCGFEKASTEDPDTPFKLTLTVEQGAQPIVGSMVRVAASVDVDATLSRIFSFGVMHLATSVAEPFTSLSDDRIEFKVTKPGTYEIACTSKVEGFGQPVTVKIFITVSTGMELVYRVEIIPPADLGLPHGEETVSVGGQDQTNLTWSVPPGRQITLSLQNKEGQGVAAYLQIQSDAAATPRHLFVSKSAESFRVSGKFHLIIVPLDSDLGPTVLLDQDADKLPNQWTVVVDGATEVAGIVSDGESPLSGAAILAHVLDQANGLEIPSTVATSDGLGAFALRAATGPARFIVVPSPASGLPTAIVEDPTLELTGDQTPWHFSYGKPKAIAFAATVLSSNGLPAPGATLRLVSTALESVGLLNVGSAQFSAHGYFALELTANENGEFVNPADGSKQVMIPSGSYRLELRPASGGMATADGFSLEDRDLLADQSLQLSLQERVSVSGTVKDKDGAAVSAMIQLEGLSGLTTGLTNHAGFFSLTVDPGQDYALLIRPLTPTAGAGPFVQPTLSAKSDLDLQEIRLPAAVSLSGTLKTHGGGAIAGALLRISCTSADCPSSQIVDEVWTETNGSFLLWVPRQ
jgi:hypothetical protein